jgi:predicted RNase H-like nuclease (RuvC/YqgF family)
MITLSAQVFGDQVERTAKEIKDEISLIQVNNSEMESSFSEKDREVSALTEEVDEVKQAREIKVNELIGKIEELKTTITLIEGEKKKETEEKDTLKTKLDESMTAHQSIKDDQ